MGSLESSLPISPPRSCCSSSVHSIRRRATDPIATSCTASTEATPAHHATLRKRSHQRCLRAEVSTTARSVAEHPAVARLPQARIDSIQPASSTTPPRSSLSTPAPESMTSYPTPHRRFPPAESHRHQIPCTVSPVVPFRLRRVPYPSLVPLRTTLPRLIAGDGRNQPVNHRRGRGEGVPYF
jgi:hypothetical protein